MTTKAKTALVIGGSGMLAGLCKELAEHYQTVGVVGRTEAKMQALLEVPNIVPIYTDYSDSVAFESALQKFTEDFGQPRPVIAWIHSSSPAAVSIAAKFCTGDFYEVTGHAGAQKDHISHEHERSIEERGLKYHRVVLGRMGSRWLTDEEISTGVARALAVAKRECLVGEL